MKKQFPFKAVQHMNKNELELWILIFSTDIFQQKVQENSDGKILLFAGLLL
jgi:hypothetical protein